ncbi:MAG: 5'-nucleotidase C-terminal domain-containing protein [Gemmatimonadota bacterium]|nr:5'-nucleotidase C-terminal domain-containing protein [Gemmatimonadota bacterium]
MNRRRALVALSIGLFIALAGCASSSDSAPPPPEAASGPACAQIFSTNDTHGRLLPAEQSWSEGRLVGGSAALAGYARQAADRAPECPLFVVSGGDIMQGTLISNLSDGASTISAFNALGYDAAAIGNHEFDWGIDILRQRVEQADFAWLGANIYETGTGDHPAWVEPWRIVEKDGVRVGFIGMTTTATPVVTRPVNVVGLDFHPISEALDRYIPEVRAEGVDFVVALMHEGGFCNSGVCEGEALEELAAATERFDYAVTGHSHSRIDAEIDGVPVVQSFSNSTAYGLGRIDRDASGQVSARLVEIRQTYVDEVTPDPAIADLVGGFEGEVAHLVGRVVTTLSRAITKPRRGDLILGRIIADAQRASTGTQVALMNSGGIRRPLPAGDITFATLFELQPFANRMVTMNVSGAQLLAALDHGMTDAGADAQISGMRAHFDPDAPSGSRIIGAELGDGTPIDPAGTYSLTVNDFMATGGGGYTMFLDAMDIVDTGIVDLDALVEYLAARPRPLPLPTEPRWIAGGG